MKVLIDPGHGGSFTGAVAGGIRESDINLIVSKYLAAILRGRGAEVWLTRDGDYALYEHDRFTDISKRAQMAGQCEANLLVSIHCNNFSEEKANGFEVWTTVGQNNSDLVAECVLVALHTHFPWKRMRTDRADGDNDREKDYNLIFEAPCPAILVEMGFLSNSSERRWLTQGANQRDMAYALALGIFEWERRYLHK